MLGWPRKRGQDTQDNRLSCQDLNQNLGGKPKPVLPTFLTPQQYPIKPCHDSPRQTFPHPQRCPIKTLAALPWARLPRLNALSGVMEPCPRVLAIKLILWTTFASVVSILFAGREALHLVPKPGRRSSPYSSTEALSSSQADRDFSLSLSLSLSRHL